MSASVGTNRRRRFHWAISETIGNASRHALHHDCLLQMIDSCHGWHMLLQYTLPNHVMVTVQAFVCLLTATFLAQWRQQTFGVYAKPAYNSRTVWMCTRPIQPTTVPTRWYTWHPPATLYQDNFGIVSLTDLSSYYIIIKKSLIFHRVFVPRHWCLICGHQVFSLASAASTPTCCQILCMIRCFCLTIFGTIWKLFCS